ncbi:HET-domain-containing protein [Aspergillus niger ATCC 13496]|uniref:HET-domain-containing protein n=1 Tax=Aspergillus niger ATCC 13496 TaxID=1353008 RepID=A0A370BGY8_ASPNG|nr:hypothetical protein ANI_1_2178094 [Aspergillus niger CBS 513.88]RDH14843.1 HET-domain-containing protein [Aspergillus niger ATCC 13496]|eukprot:XP_001394635.2 hypothetical protein ANI_1_2178094 [Aspergillus niger CBS 513.88]
MRLINVNTLKLEEFQRKVPRYAILSHTWGADHEELSFRDINECNIGKGSLPFKVAKCCEQAEKDGLKYAWVDTCCIDKTNSVELGEAINSMFRWYNGAAVCYAYLADVTSGYNRSFPLAQFCSCRWFQRGWTLQELLAPDSLRFYDSEWRYLGTKANRSSTIERKIGIPRRFLQGTALGEASIAQRMSWASKRETKREEDIAYCLLGIFDVNMPMIYGEGGVRAFTRLQRKIMRSSKDESILAWGFQAIEPPTIDSEDLAVSAGVLAASPADFTNCGEIVPRKDKAKSPTTFTIEGGLVRISLPLFSTITGEVFGLLNCGPQHERKAVVGIPLSDKPSGEYLRPQGRSSYSFSIDKTRAPAQPVYIQIGREKKSVSEVSAQNYFYIDDPIETGLELIEVEPQSRWWKDRSLIMTSNDPADDTTQQTWTRFRTEGEGSSDFLVLLEFQSQGSQVQARCHLMTASRSTSLVDVAQRASCIRQDAFGKSGASDSTHSIQASVERDSVQEIFVVKLTATASPPSVTIDATFELEVLMLKIELESIMKDEDDLRLEAEYFDKPEEETISSFESAKASLSEIEEEIKRLNEQKVRLLKLLNRASRSVRVEEFRQREAILSERRKSFAGRLDGRQQAVLNNGYGLLLHQTPGRDTVAVNSSANPSVVQSSSIGHSGWVHGYDEPMLSDTEVEEAEAELAELVDSEVELAKVIDEMFRRDHFLSQLFSDKRGFIIYLYKKALDMYPDSDQHPEYKNIVTDTINVSMHQQVFYCAIGHEDRWDVQKKFVKLLAKLTTQVIPAGKGVALRFINREVDNSPNLTFERVQKIMDSMPLRLVYSKIISQSLDRPLLITITIAGRPETEAESEFMNAIRECGRKLERAGYPRNTVVFMIYQIGTNKKTVEFLQRLQGDPDILPVTNVIPHHKYRLRMEVIRDRDGLEYDYRNFSGLEDSEIEEPSPRKVLGPERTIYTSHIVVPGNGLPLLSDFGEARFSEEEHDEDIMRNLYRAPEVVLMMKWDNKVDVWSSALMTWDMVCSQTLFDGRNSDDVFDDRVHLAEMVAIMGPPPTEFIKRSKVGSIFWDEDGKWKELAPVPNMTLEERAANIQGPNKEEFLKFVRRALT